MKIRTLKLYNFRCFKEIKVEFHERLTVFVGTNGAGKSAILDALGIGLGAMLNRFPFQKKKKQPALEQQDITISCDSDQEAFMRVGVVAEDNGSKFEWDRTRLRDQLKNTKKLSGTIPRKDLKEVQSYVDKIVEAKNNSEGYILPVFAVYGTNRAVDVPHNRLQKRILPRTFTRLAGLERALNPKPDFKLSVGAFEIFENRVLREQRDGLEPKSLPGLDAIRQAVQTMTPNLANPRIDPSGRFAVDMVQAETATKLYLDQLSDGYQIALGVVMDFATRLALAAAEGSTATDILSTEAIMIIDEVDLHLHPSWQQIFLSRLLDVFPRTQFIVSTHSPQVLSTVGKESIQCLFRNSLDKVELARMDTEVKGLDSAAALLEVMGVDPTPPNLEEVRWQRDYTAKIENGSWPDPDGLELRNKLEQFYGAHHPVILNAERLIRFQDFKLNRKPARP